MPETSGFPNDGPHPTAGWMSQNHMGHAQLDENLNDSENNNDQEFERNSPQESTTTTSDAAWITDLGLSTLVIAHLLDRFRSMASYFPFVRLSNDWNATSMAEHRPFLLLAAAIAASSNQCHLQDALIRQFKESLSQHALVAGEQDLDLLQGLLVFLAW